MRITAEIEIEDGKFYLTDAELWEAEEFLGRLPRWIDQIKKARRNGN